MTEQEYNEIRRRTGATVPIFGVAVGANYDEFRRNLRSVDRSRAEGLTEGQSLNVLWTGIEENGRSAYADCLQTLRQSSQRLHMAVSLATEDEVSILLIYNAVGDDPRRISLVWDAPQPARGELPSTIAAGATRIVFRRPERDAIIGVNAAGLSPALVLRPLPRPVVEAPAAALAERCEITDPAPRSPVRRTGSVAWPCPAALRAGRYEVTISVPATATSAPSNNAAVHYRLTVEAVESSVVVRTLQASGNGIADFVQIRRAGHSPAEISSDTGSIVELPDGPVLIRLFISAIYDHHNERNNNAGTLNVQGGTRIVLRRLP